MADSTTYHRFALTFTSPWNIGTVTTHNWHCKFSVSGTIVMTAADAQATAIALAQPILDVASSKTYLSAWAYYPSGTNVAAQFGSFLPTDHPGTGNAYGTGPFAPAQLEVVGLARSLVGKNSKGKPVYLRKWCHDVQVLQSNPNSFGGVAGTYQGLKAWNTGSGPHNVVPVSPTTGLQGGPWTFETHAYTHQLRRGAKKKKISPAAPSFLSQLVAAGYSIAQALEIISKLPPIG